MMSLLQRVHPQNLRLIALAIVLVLLVLFFATQIDNYLSPRMLNRIGTSAALFLPVAIGQALVVITRNIDLSVGSLVGFLAFFMGDMLGHYDLGPFLTVVAIMILGGFFGAINGVLVSYGKVPSIIVTLGTLAIFRALLIEYSGSRTITTDSMPKWVADFPQLSISSLIPEWASHWFKVIGFTDGVFDLRLTVAMALIAALVFGIALSRMRSARKLYAVGSNPDAAIMAGINSPRVVFWAFVLSGAMAGLGGFMFLARFGNITVGAGLGFEFKSVSEIVVGGVNIFGGSGSMFGVVLGTVLVDTLENSLLRWQVISEFWRDALLGMLIILAVAADTFMTRSFTRLRAKKDV